jgi:hypothetical protein
LNDLAARTGTREQALFGRRCVKNVITAMNGGRTMKPFTLIAIIVFAFIALMQLLRFILGWEITVNGVVVPVWLSGIAFVILGGLSALLWRETRQ